MSLRIAIIGAGMAGVSAGRLLADRGAQYFTLRHLDFSAAVQQTCGEALCRITAPVLD
jgi:predicted NAD/FAD-dependent oxidoreductase